MTNNETPPPLPPPNPYPNGSTKGFLPEKTYDALKWLALVFLPAFGSFYFSLGTLWDFPNIEKVSGTILLVDTFLGVILGISNQMYKKSDARYDGALRVFNTVGEGGVEAKAFQVDVGDMDLWELEKNKELTLKVVPPK